MEDATLNKSFGSLRNPHVYGAAGRGVKIFAIFYKGLK